MFKISDFSKLSQVSSKALRYYDDIGLLKPKHVDRFTGYRYYAVDQLPRLNRIIVLKELGFSLEQIMRLLEDNISAEQIQGMLQMKEAEIERHIEAEQQRLRRVQARLQQITREDAHTAYDVITRQVESVQIASIREHIPDYSYIGQLFGALFACLEGKNMSGSPFVLYHDGEYRDQDVDVEAAIVVGAVAEDTMRVRFSTLAAVTLAATIHTGAYETLSSAYSALLQWIESNGYDISPPNREFYLRGPGLNRSPEDYVTEIQFPILKRAPQEQQHKSEKG